MFTTVHICVDCKEEFPDPAPAMMPPDLSPNLDGSRTLQCRTCHRIAHEAMGFGGEGSGCTLCEPPACAQSPRPLYNPSGTLVGLGFVRPSETLTPAAVDAAMQRMAPDALYAEMERQRIRFEASRRPEHAIELRETLNLIRSYEKVG